MVRKRIMLIAGETSGDLLGAELVPILREKIVTRAAIPTRDLQPLQASLEPEFFGAGGPQMAAAGVALALDMTEHAVVGLWEVVKSYARFRRIFGQLRQLAIDRRPDVIICIDFSGFNLRFGSAIRKYVRQRRATFGNWNPRLVQYVSPQVWASRPGRAERLARDFDLLLSIFPFEREWYAQKTPRLRVEFVGHPIIDRYAAWAPVTAPAGAQDETHGTLAKCPKVLLLPGSRPGELKRHLPVMLGALDILRSAKPALRASMILPNESLAQAARACQLPSGLALGIGNLTSLLPHADVAIASTGTVLLECAGCGVPTVALYKTSPATFWAAKRLVQVQFLAMPNLLANEEIYPEFIQDAATPENLARAAIQLLDDAPRRVEVQSKLAKIVASLGAPGAAHRAADAILDTMRPAPAIAR